jgi:DHA1 family inner membrane transport protein
VIVDAPHGPTGPRVGPTIARLTAAKTVANTALRWIPPFLPTLERAFGASTTQLTTILGIGELGGLTTVSVGSALDRGRERTVMVASLLSIVLSSIIALGGSTTTFAIAFFVLVIGVSNLTVAGQTWISHRIAYARRARVLGLFETSWALALLVGAPVVAVLINVFGWRGPFVAIAVAASVSAFVLATSLASTRRVELVRAASVAGPAGATPRTPRRAAITPAAWLVMTGSAATAMAGLSVFVVSGSWLDDQFGVSTGGIGVVAIGFGGAELTSSLTSAAIADRAGKLRSTLAGLACLALGLALLVTAGDQLWLGVVALLVFLLGFEFAFVTSLSLVSEAMPDARGNALAVSNAVGTIARAAGAVLSGWLFGAHGISGTVVLSGSAAFVAAGCLLVSRRSGTIRAAR